MTQPADVLGRDIKVGDRVGCAFSYSQASVGHIRLGVIEELYEGKATKYSNYTEIFVKVRWDEDGKLSPALKYGANTRWIRL